MATLFYPPTNRSGSHGQTEFMFQGPTMTEAAVQRRERQCPQLPHGHLTLIVQRELLEARRGVR